MVYKSPMDSLIILRMHNILRLGCWIIPKDFLGQVTWFTLSIRKVNVSQTFNIAWTKSNFYKLADKQAWAWNKLEIFYFLDALTSQVSDLLFTD